MGSKCSYNIYLGDKCSSLFPNSVKCKQSKDCSWTPLQCKSNYYLFNNSCKKCEEVYENAAQCTNNDSNSYPILEKCEPGYTKINSTSCTYCKNNSCNQNLKKFCTTNNITDNKCINCTELYPYCIECNLNGCKQCISNSILQANYIEQTQNSDKNITVIGNCIIENTQDHPSKNNCILYSSDYTKCICTNITCINDKINQYTDITTLMYNYAFNQETINKENASQDKSLIRSEIIIGVLSGFVILISILLPLIICIVRKKSNLNSINTISLNRSGSNSSSNNNNESNSNNPNANHNAISIHHHSNRYARNQMNIVSLPNQVTAENNSQSPQINSDDYQNSEENLSCGFKSEIDKIKCCKCKNDATFRLSCKCFFCDDDIGMAIDNKGIDNFCGKCGRNILFVERFRYKCNICYDYFEMAFKFNCNCLCFYCNKCSMKILNSNNGCPFCRKNVDNIQMFKKDVAYFGEKEKNEGKLVMLDGDNNSCP